MKPFIKNMDVIWGHCTLVRIHIEHLNLCDALPADLSLVRYSKINWYKNYFFQRNLTPYKATPVTAKYQAKNKKEKKKIVRER